MARWSPTVVPNAPRMAAPIDLGGALSTLADGFESRRQREREAVERARVEQRQDDRYFDQQNQQRIDTALTRQRQEALDLEASKDRQLNRESNYLLSRERARDSGYIDAGAAGQRASAARDLQGAPDAFLSNVGDALYAASTSGPRTELTRPDGTRESLQFDPTQTKEARDEQAWVRRETLQQSRKPAPRDPVADDLAVYDGKLALDKKYGAGDFKPRTGSGRASVDPRIGVADRMYDNAASLAARVDRSEPKAPTFDKYMGMSRPLEGEPTYLAFRADSVKKADGFEKSHTAWQGRAKAATDQMMQWQTLADGLARAAVGATGGDALFTSQQIAAQREIDTAGREFRANMAAMQGDPVGQREQQEAFTADVQRINQKYGIRPRPED